MYNKVHRLGQHACVGYEPTRGSVMIDGGELCHDDHQAFDNVAGLDKTDNHTSGNLKMRHLQSADSDLTDVRLTQKGKWEFAKEIPIMLIYLFFLLYNFHNVRKWKKKKKVELLHYLACTQVI